MKFPPIFFANSTLKSALQSTKSIARSLVKPSYYRSIWNKQEVKPPFKHVVQIGDPVLRQKAVAVPPADISSSEIQQIIDTMIYVMKRHRAVGLVAPQIGVSKQILIMHFPESMKTEFKPEIYRARKMNTLPLKVFINPVIKVTDFVKNKHSESCESVRGYFAEVARYEGITLSGLDRNGCGSVLKLNGWNARIAQHEMDHLNGIIYTDIMVPKTLTCGCWEAVNYHQGQIRIEFNPRGPDFVDKLSRFFK